MTDPTTSSIITALVSGLVGGVGVSSLNFFLNRKKTDAEIDKLRAEAEQIRRKSEAEIDKLRAEADSLRLETKAKVDELSATVQSFTSEQVLFDGSSKIDGFDVRGQEGQLWSDAEGKRVGPKAQGSLRIEDGRVLNIQRFNREGRFEVWLLRYLYNGKEHRFIPKNEIISGRRKLRISGEFKAANAEHILRVVVRNPESGLRLAQETIKIATNEWMEFEIYLQADPAQDAEIRIDDEDMSAAPSSVQIRRLRVIEVK